MHRQCLPVERTSGFDPLQSRKASTGRRGGIRAASDEPRAKVTFCAVESIHKAVGVVILEQANAT